MCRCVRARGQAGAAELFRVPLLLCLICGGVLIVIVLLIAVELSRPLKQSAFESQRIAESIGHPEIDLRAPDQRPGPSRPALRGLGVLSGVRRARVLRGRGLRQREGRPAGRPRFPGDAGDAAAKMPIPEPESQNVTNDREV
eukprot:361795-Rhodomonas_salina.1